MEIVKDETTTTEQTTVQEITTGPGVKAQYDPRKNYGWAADTPIVISGAEFGLILNTLRRVVATEEAATIILADKACQAIEGIMSRSVENGVINEKTQ